MSQEPAQETEAERKAREEEETKQFWEESRRRDQEKREADLKASEKRAGNVKGILVLLIILAMVIGTVAVGITMVKKKFK